MDENCKKPYKNCTIRLATCLRGIQTAISDSAAAHGNGGPVLIR